LGPANLFNHSRLQLCRAGLFAQKKKNMDSRTAPAAAYGLYLSNIEVREVLRLLNSAGFRSEEIGLLPAGSSPSRRRKSAEIPVERNDSQLLLTMLSLGFPAALVKRLVAQIRRRNFLIYVLSKDVTRATWARELLRRTKASETGIVERINVIPVKPRKKVKAARAAA
jgi:hypothetical protein